jgi:hypothetical protein
MQVQGFGAACLSALPSRVRGQQKRNLFDSSRPSPL